MLFLLPWLSSCASASHFNETAAAQKSQPDRILGTLSLKPGMRVADLGAGGGYFALRFARRVGERGKVYAIDVKPDYLDFIRARAEEKGLNNVTTLLAEENSSGLPDNSVDLVFLRDVYHHLQERPRYFERLAKALRKQGRVAIIDYHESGLWHRLFGHSTPRETIIREMKEAGYRLIESHDFLERQSFTIYARGRGTIELSKATKTH
jgi:ubiquinone/menaquinone biosynthesis C-methylase UbiE